MSPSIPFDDQNSGGSGWHAHQSRGPRRGKVSGVVNARRFFDGTAPPSATPGAERIDMRPKMVSPDPMKVRPPLWWPGSVPRPRDGGPAREGCAPRGVGREPGSGYRPQPPHITPMPHLQDFQSNPIPRRPRDSPLQDEPNDAQSPLNIAKRTQSRLARRTQWRTYLHIVPGITVRRREHSGYQRRDVLNLLNLPIRETSQARLTPPAYPRGPQHDASTQDRHPGHFHRLEPQQGRGRARRRGDVDVRQPAVQAPQGRLRLRAEQGLDRPTAIVGRPVQQRRVGVVRVGRRAGDDQPPRRGRHAPEDQHRREGLLQGRIPRQDPCRGGPVPPTWN